MLTVENNFLALGSAIAGIGILATGLLALLFRNPRAPRWTRPEVVAMLLCVPVTATIGFGLGYLAYGLSQLANGGGDPRELPALAAVVIALPLLWRGLRIRHRLKAYATTGASTASGATAISPSPAPEAPPRATVRGAAAGLPGTRA
jgi:heme A synthase